VTEPLTLMAVHAHPDDESSSTGGILAKYSEEGIRTVVVTCTNGELGDGPGGVKPGEAGHDGDAVARTRRDELERACETLGVTHLEMLGYHDSGMPDWEYKDDVAAFCNVPLEVVGGQLTELFERYRPAVVTTYNDADGYDHPDHLHASRATMRAVDQSGIPAKAYCSCMRRSDFQRFFALLEELGVAPTDMPEPNEEFIQRMDELERRITTSIDVQPFLERKRQALTTHASQIEESFFGKLPTEAFGTIFAHEHFVRARDTTDAPVPEDDLFAGLR